MSARRNLTLFLPYQIASLEGLSQGLYLVWLLQAKHLRPEVGALVLSAGSLALTALEVPTGVLADRFGHRGSLIAGSVAQVAGIALFWRSDEVLGLLAGSLAVALGDALRSGADAALLYESCVQLGRAGDFGPLYARSTAASTLALAALTLGGGCLAQLAGFDLVWLAETSLCACGLGLALAMSPVPVVSVSDAEEGGRRWGWPTRTALREIILPTTLVGVLGAIYEMVVQATWPVGDSLILLTGAVAASALAESLGAVVASRLGQAVSVRRLAALAVALALLGMTAPIPGLWALALLTGWALPLRAEAIQRLARPGERASAASWAGVIDMAANALLLPLAAWVWVPRTRRGRVE